MFKELKSIAGAFPYLEMTAHLYNGEYCEQDAKPIIEYGMKEGKVSAYIPVLTLRTPYEDLDVKMQREFTGIRNDPYRERGCTIKQFKWAWEYTLKVMAHKEDRK